MLIKMCSNWNSQKLLVETQNDIITLQNNVIVFYTVKYKFHHTSWLIQLGSKLQVWAVSIQGIHSKDIITCL